MNFQDKMIVKQEKRLQEQISNTQSSNIRERLKKLLQQVHERGRERGIVFQTNKLTILFSIQAITILREAGLLGKENTTCPAQFKTSADKVWIFGKWQPAIGVKCGSYLFYKKATNNRIYCQVCNPFEIQSEVIAWYQTTARNIKTPRTYAETEFIYES